MIMAHSEIKLTFNYDDNTTRDLKLGPFDTDAAIISAATLRSNVKAFDANAIKGAFLSETGASCTGISGASIYEISETDINLND